MLRAEDLDGDVAGGELDRRPRLAGDDLRRRFILVQQSPPGGGLLNW